MTPHERALLRTPIRMTPRRSAMTDDERQFLRKLAELQRAILAAQGEQLRALLQIQLAQQRAQEALGEMMRVMEAWQRKDDA